MNELSQFTVAGTVLSAESRSVGNRGMTVVDLIIEREIHYQKKDGTQSVATRPVKMQVSQYDMNPGQVTSIPPGTHVLVSGEVSGYASENNGRTFYNSSLEVKSITLLGGGELTTIGAAQESDELF